MKHQFSVIVFGNMVIFGFMVNFMLVPTWTIYPGASVFCPEEDTDCVRVRLLKSHTNTWSNCTVFMLTVSDRSLLIS